MTATSSTSQSVWPPSAGRRTQVTEPVELEVNLERGYLPHATMDRRDREETAQLMHRHNHDIRG